ncbi:hypothetical protein B0H17DRAFT_1081918 [Mycena rosella]|uniref:Uncharacterized protein n=1 Tax=Mycena rosella TaxID=1033263 RepID=A0AAD7D1R6_MYCRO|nr:hypothetical protein B0H17DRAFT_1081918 [Mycena rosella]
MQLLRGSTSSCKLLPGSYSPLPAATPLLRATTLFLPGSTMVLRGPTAAVRAPTSFYAVTLTLLRAPTRLLQECYAVTLGCSVDRDLRYDATSATGSY